MEPFVAFIQHTLTSTQASRLAISGDASETDKYLYANLVLTNMLLQQAMKDTTIKIKSSKLGLDAQYQALVLEKLLSHSATVNTLVSWTSDILGAY